MPVYALEFMVCYEDSKQFTRIFKTILTTIYFLGYEKNVVRFSNKALYDEYPFQKCDTPESTERKANYSYDVYEKIN